VIGEGLDWVMYHRRETVSEVQNGNTRSLDRFSVKGLL
jgi:hypothetical protein